MYDKIHGSRSEAVMASSQAYWEEQLDNRLGKLEEDVRSMKSLPYREQQMVVNASKIGLKGVRELKKNFDLATRALGDNTKKAAGKEKVREAERRLRIVEDELRRTELLLTEDRLRVEQKNSDGEYLESIKVVQDKTKESLDRQVKKINETLEVAGRTAEKLDGQGEKIDRLGADVMEMGETLSGAREHIRRFKRTVSRDRICQSLLALNLIIFGVIASMLGFEWPAFRHAAGVR